MKPKTELATTVERILELALPQRATAIIDSPYTAEIMERIPTQDAYLIIKESFGSDSAILLPYTPPEKIVSFIDLDCWQGDTLTTDNLQEWISELAHASTETLLEALTALDLELVILLFQPHLQVIITRPTDDNIPELVENGYQTFDNNYFFTFNKFSKKTQLLRTILETLFAQAPDLYYRILEGVRWELPANMEETALQQRSLRLMELGFPPPPEAKSIYQYLKPEKILARGFRPEKAPRLGEAEYFVPSLYRAGMPSGALIETGLATLDAATRERFNFEMVYLTNKIIMADYQPLNDAEAVRLAAAKSADMVALGLALAMRAKGQTAPAVLEALNAESLFALAFNTLILLQRRLKDVLAGVASHMIPPAYREPTEGLLLKMPRYRDRSFSHLAELDLVTAAVDKLAVLRAIIHHIPWKGHALDNTNINLDGLDMENIILTALAVNIATRELTFRPLTSDEFNAFLARTTARHGHARRCQPGFAPDLTALLLGLDDTLDRRILADTVDSLVKRYEEEISGLKDLERVDPRFLTCLVVNLEGA